ncbi:MAG: hypothetical protein AB8B78_08425 [Polaribacter sp.]
MLKKIFGGFFILLSIFFGLGFLLQMPKILNAFSSEDLAFGIGYIIGSLLFLLIAYISYKIGIKLIKNKVKISETLDQIGKK